MIYRVLADAVVVAHFAFIIFVFVGGFLAFRWPKVAWAHVPCFVWGAGTALLDWGCPLTDVEKYFRQLGTEPGYPTGFVEEYIVPLVYPELLFPGGFPDNGFLWIGLVIVALNGTLYWRIWAARKRLVGAPVPGFERDD